jgi:lipoprotein-anchoring transpeptidase ErfK/SrfK
MRRNYYLWIILILPYLFLITGYFIHRNIIREIPDSKFIIINKDDYTLRLYTYKGELLDTFKVGIGINPGNKAKLGDKKTPEGVFQVISIEDSKDWSYDFMGDSLPDIKGAYGPWFIRINANGFRGIGIHGTLDETTLGSRTSQGCIRLKNSELNKLKKLITIGTLVIILPSINDIEADQLVK